MPYIAEHFGVINPSERLLPHNVGIKDEVVGLFMKYQTLLTSFRNNNSIRWENTAEHSAVRDLSIDTKNGFLFYIAGTSTSGVLVSRSLKTGELVWKKTIGQSSYINHSPKHKMLYVTQGAKVICFDYLGNPGKNLGTGYGSGRVGVLDKYDRIVVHVIGSISGTSYTKRIILDMDLTPILYIGDYSPPTSPILGKKQAEMVYWTEGASIYGSDIINEPKTGKLIVSGGGISSSSYTVSGPRILDGDIGYVMVTTDSGNPFTSYEMRKISLIDGVIWRKQFANTATRYTGNEYTFTQDANNLYTLINPKTSTQGIPKQIIVLNKETAAVSYLPINPDLFVNDPFVQLLHTFDVSREW